MTVSYTVGEGMTGVLDFKLLTVDPDTEAESVYDPTGETVNLYLKSVATGLVATFSTGGASPKLTITTNGDGDKVVRFAPASTDLKLTDKKYIGHFTVTHSDATIDRFPSDGNFELPVIDTGV